MDVCLMSTSLVSRWAVNTWDCEERLKLRQVEHPQKYTVVVRVIRITNMSHDDFVLAGVQGCLM
eukprot:7310036-Pyramimonas_sp.AAC.1